MQPSRVFRNPPTPPHEFVIEALERALLDPSALADATHLLVGCALNDDDAGFIEQLCVSVGTRATPGSPLLGLAALCLGHTARRFGRLGDDALALAESLATRAELDPSDVDMRAVDGYDDIRTFLDTGEQTTER